MTYTTLPRRIAETKRRSQGEETLIEKAADGSVVALRSVEFRIWEMCDGRTEVSAAAKTLSTEFGAVTEDDVRNAVEKLNQMGLLAPEVMPNRRQDAMATTIEDETLIYVPTTGLSTRLDATATLVWSFCDGKTPVSLVVAALTEKLQVEAQAAEELVWVTLNKLSADGYLVRQPVGVASSRRDFLLRFATAAALFPVVASAVAPQPSQAYSQGNCYSFGATTTESCQPLANNGPLNTCKGCSSNGIEPCPAGVFCMGVFRVTVGGSCTTEYQNIVDCNAENGGETQQSCATARAFVVAAAGGEANAAAANGGTGAVYRCCQC